MSDEVAFLSAIRKNPDDDTARLVYADWLDETGQHERAEYIRLRHQFAQLTGRLNDLTAQFDPVWLATIGGPRTKLHEITLRSGRNLWLRELRQWNFHEGVLLGIPTSQDNQEDLERLLARERERWWGGEPYLISPEERPMPPSDHPPHAGEPRGLFPTIACVGRFTSSQPVRDLHCRVSQLVVIWFQDEFALPIEPAVREHIRAIEWEKHAADSDY